MSPRPSPFIFRRITRCSRLQLDNNIAARSPERIRPITTFAPSRWVAHSRQPVSSVYRRSQTFPLQQQRTLSSPSAFPCAAAPRRSFATTTPLAHAELTPPKPGEELHVTFVTKEGNVFDFEVAEGDNLLDIAQSNDLEMEGACGGSCACSTCHVIVESQDMYDKLEEPDDDENDMLDLAFGLTETSRLGCQVKMSKDIDGLKVKLPSMTRNLQASDFK